jgi:cell division septation protein DedD
VTLGSPLANPFDSPGQSIAAPTLSAQLSFDPTTSPNPVVSPVNGVITGWKVKSADDGALYTLKVLRPNGPVSLVVATDSSFTAVRSVAAPSAVPAGTAVGTPTGVIFSYPASLPISKGDYIGELATGAVSDIPQHTTGGVPKNLTSNNFAGQPADGAAANLMADEQHELLLQATIQFTPPASPVTAQKPKCKKKAKKRSAEIAKKKCKKKRKKK